MTCFAAVTLTAPNISIIGETVNNTFLDNFKTNVQETFITDGCDSITLYGLTKHGGGLSVSHTGTVDKLLILMIPSAFVQYLFLDTNNNILGSVYAPFFINIQPISGNVPNYIIDYSSYATTAATGCNDINTGFVDSTVSGPCFTNGGALTLLSAVLDNYKVMTNGVDTNSCAIASSSDMPSSALYINNPKLINIVSIPNPCDSIDSCPRTVYTNYSDQHTAGLTIRSPAGIAGHPFGNTSGDIDILTGLTLEYTDTAGDSQNITPTADTSASNTALETRGVLSNIKYCTIFIWDPNGVPTDQALVFALRFYTDTGIYGIKVDVVMPTIGVTTPAGLVDGDLIVDYTELITVSGLNPNDVGFAVVPNPCEAPFGFNNLNPRDIVFLDTGSSYKVKIVKPTTDCTTRLHTIWGAEAVTDLTPPICLARGSLVETDQGEIPIEEINDNYTIDGNEVDKVVESSNNFSYMVLIKKSALELNVPNKDTYLSYKHRVMHNNTIQTAIKMINGTTIIKYKTKEPKMYNVLLKHKKHSTMKVHNMVVETLDPFYTNKIYKPFYIKNTLGSKLATITTRTN